MLNVIQIRFHSRSHRLGKMVRHILDLMTPTFARQGMLASIARQVIAFAITERGPDAHRKTGDKGIGCAIQRLGKHPTRTFAGKLAQ